MHTEQITNGPWCHVPDWMLSGEVTQKVKYGTTEDCIRRHVDVSDFVSC